MRPQLSKEQIKAIADRAEGKPAETQASPPPAPESEFVRRLRAMPITDQLREFATLLRANRAVYKDSPEANLSSYRVTALIDQILSRNKKA